MLSINLRALQLTKQFMDILKISNIKLAATIGVYQWEQAIKQTIVLDLAISIPTKLHSEKTLEDTIDYKSLYEKLEKFVDSTSCKLIEDLAEKISHFIYENYNIVENLKLSIKKPYAISPDVEFTIDRSKAQIKQQVT